MATIQPGLLIPHLRKRRGLVTLLRYLPPGAIIIATPPERETVGKSGRSSYQQARVGKLKADDIESIKHQADRTLRELAAEYGVSRETIRATRLGAIPDDPGDNVQGGFTPAWITPCLKR
jgi:hypothetical protein